MQRIAYTFTNSTVQYYLDTDFIHLEKLADREHAVIITDEHIQRRHQRKLKDWAKIVIPPGEGSKVQSVVDTIIARLLFLGADRDTLLIGVGGGVVTDITGYVASVYMRGLKFGFVPTTLLAMVDAAIGGKNGVDVGPYKNMVGTIRQPAFLLYDYKFLKTLPAAEWINGFAEIIKHAAIADPKLFRELEGQRPAIYRKDSKKLSLLVRRNVLIKSGIVKKDEFEKSDRKLLNFGHSLGHAIENLYGLSHGQAISIGMAYAAIISEEITGFKETERLHRLLASYGLPLKITVQTDKIMAVLRMDKKRQKEQIRYILLDKIGKARVIPIPMERLERILEAVLDKG
jgi:3-dehydroquinate synthase